MSPRSIRRAQERQALKEARKAGQRQLSQTPPSRAQLEANRANAQLSTGPKTAEGKAKVSPNAVKTGLTGRTVLLPGDDLAAYNALAERMRRLHVPVGQQEQEIVQSLVDIEWRLQRIPELESAIYALAMRRLADQFADVEDETTRIALLRGEAYLQHARQFANLSIQESRLLRRRDKETAALRELQRRRQEAETRVAVDKLAVACAAAASSRTPAAQPLAAPNLPDPNIGFEFSDCPQHDALASQLTREILSNGELC